MPQKIKSFLFPVVIIFITFLISFLNYTPGTFLTGWDTLHPEFNFAQQFSNILFGVFRTDQGLGAISAHSHMAEFPRILLLWLFSFILPLSFLRYSIIFLCFILGPLGIYFFIKHILKTQNNGAFEQWNNSSSVASFLAALFYIFNLGTVQHFYVPFEMFTVQYAALPWIFLFALKFIERPRMVNLLLFALANFLASPMAYASVLWYAYFAFLLMFLGVFWAIKRGKRTILTIAILIITLISVNAYWILPNLYFLATNARNISQGQTNKIFSDEAFAYNKQYGNLKDTTILRNFLFSWTEQKDARATGDLMTPWKMHLNKPFVLSIGYIVFAIVGAGALISITKRNIIGIALIPGLIFSLIMVMNMNPPFESLFSYLRDSSPIIREGLRFPFTKFSILLMFSMSVFFAISARRVLQILTKLTDLRVNILPIGVFLVSVAALVWYGFPMFSGALIDERMRIRIPAEYFQLFDYLSQKPQDERVALLPLQSIWGWEYYNWGYQGAGFIWFGIKQPVLSRDFDRWNQDNEQYFREMSSAVYSRDVSQVETLAKKYRISYFLLDESVIFPGYKQNALWHYESKDIFEKSLNIKLEKQFGHLYLYRVNTFLTGVGYIQKPKNITFIGPEITGGFVDLAAQNHGDYIVSGNPDFTYFSRSLVDRYDRVNPSNISLLDNTLLLKLGKNKGYGLTDSWLSNDIFPEFMRKSYDLTIEKEGLPFLIGDEQFIFFPVTTGPVNISDSLITSDNCGVNSHKSRAEIVKNINSVSFKAQNTSSCGFITFSGAKQDFGSMLIIEARNQKGLPIRLCISENITERCGIYTSLDFGNSWKRYVFMIPPQPSGASGYAVHFNTVGIGNDESVNDIRFVQLIQIPYYRIANLSFVKDSYKPRKNAISKLSVEEINPTLYKVNLSFEKNQDGLIVLYKAYDSGWKAYEIKLKTQNSPARNATHSVAGGKLKTFLVSALPFVFGTELKEHVEVNSWANGWLINDERRTTNEERIIVVYLPQYLEYAGLAILAVTFGVLLGRFLFLRESV